MGKKINLSYWKLEMIDRKMIRGLGGCGGGVWVVGVKVVCWALGWGQ